MLVALPWWLVVAIDAAAWATWSAVVGRWHARLPEHRLTRDGPVLRLRAGETPARYERLLRVKRWKDRLPEAGTWFGGTTKRRLPRATGGHPARLASFAVECRRAERTHWCIVAATPAFAVWNPVGLFLAMVAFAMVANGPCIVALRYNRARLARHSTPA
jgi:glycosyl-4,4'-diaponeurosporenoate acyltransferase